MDKFYVYVIRNGENQVRRVYTDNDQIKFMLKEQEDVDVQLLIVRALTNQVAILSHKHDAVMWKDVDDATSSETLR